MYLKLQGSVPVAWDRLYELLHEPPIKVAIFGPLLSAIADTVAQVVGRWSIVEVRIQFRT